MKFLDLNSLYWLNCDIFSDSDKNIRGEEENMSVVKIKHLKKSVRELSNDNYHTQANENGLRYADFHFLDKKILERALTHLQYQKKRNRLNEENCRPASLNKPTSDNQVKLRCRQLMQVIQELRKAVLRQDWDETAALLMILTLSKMKLYRSIINKVCYILLFCHSNSNMELLQNFTRKITGYKLNEDIIKFIKVLFILKKYEYKSWNNNKHAHTKLVQDPEFCDV